MTSEIDLSRGGYAVTALRLCVATDVAALACSLVSLWLLSRLAAGEPVDDDQITAIDGAAGMVAVIALVALVFAAVTFIRWLLQARRNVEALGARGLVHSREWAVWGWFVPFLNLFRPYQVVDEVWRGSDPQPSRPFGLMSLETPSLLGLWWGAWLLNGVLGQVVFRMQSALDESDGIAASVLIAAHRHVRRRGGRRRRPHEENVRTLESAVLVMKNGVVYKQPGQYGRIDGVKRGGSMG